MLQTAGAMHNAFVYGDGVYTPPASRLVLTQRYLWATLALWRIIFAEC